ncbi:MULTISPECIES: serine/threonine-protein kinase [unclassified Streptomyces]|uniref:serine/threonine-protein kinase n=1 Tax=unclassified Streptomyces TaxID=2593676 RepID=UPI0019040DD2|nr:serine/threonine-protein kinase [Streptomyces sp. HSG2]
MDMAMMRLRREDPRVVGSFRLHRRLGAGGMGVVYLGSDRRGQRVALKVIRPDLAEDQEFRSRFAREVSAARRIRGGCTARLVAADLEADRPWFATQYVPGPSLHDQVVDEGPLSAADVAAVGAALFEGLVAVHEAGVVHRDLKPSNILLSPKGPRIIDFGIAWATGASTLTHVGTAVGSPGFLAPEQVRGAAVTPATDVFSMGATLAYASMGDSPFGHGSSEVMLYRVVHEEPQLRGVPDALAPLVRACLAKDPQERPGTPQLSLRLKEIAAREAQGITEARPPTQRGREADRPSVRVSTSGTPGPRGDRDTRPTPGRTRPPGTSSPRARRREGSSRGGGRITPVRSTPLEDGAGRRGNGTTPATPRSTPGGTGRNTRPGLGGHTSRGGAPGNRATRPTRAWRGPANPRLLRQRLFVFVVVTALVALGIALAQSCRRDARSLEGERTDGPAAVRIVTEDRLGVERPAAPFQPVGRPAVTA